VRCGEGVVRDGLAPRVESRGAYSMSSENFVACLARVDDRTGRGASGSGTVVELLRGSRLMGEETRFVGDDVY